MKRSGYAKKMNEYATVLDARLYRRTPKAVFAAIAVSRLSEGGSFLEEAQARLLDEWAILHENKILPQPPPVTVCRRV